MICTIDKLGDISYLIHPVGEVLFLHYSAEFERIFHITYFFVTTFSVIDFANIHIFFNTEEIILYLLCNMPKISVFKKTNMPQIVITDSASDVLFIFFGTKTFLYSFLTPLNSLFTKGFLYYEIFRNDFFRNTTYPRI